MIQETKLGRPKLGRPSKNNTAFIRTISREEFMKRDMQSPVSSMREELRTKCFHTK